MKTLHLKPRRAELKDWKNRFAEEAHAPLEVEPGTLIRDADTDELLVAHVDLTEKFPADLLAACKGIEFRTSPRTNGMMTTSRTFGFQPRVAIRRDYCSAALAAREHPAEHVVLCRWAAKLTELYDSINPIRFARHQKAIAGVKPCWRLPRSVFTSGIVNWDNRLAYHRDQGNFPNLWSFMVVLMRDTDGGGLAIPELGATLRFGGATVTAFDGADLIHGVTALHKKSAAAYRYSIVWYAMQGMCACGTLQEELERIRRVKTAREGKRVSPK